MKSGPKRISSTSKPGSASHPFPPSALPRRAAAAPGRLQSRVAWEPLSHYAQPTTRETILQALHALLQTQPAPVLRGEVLPERVPASGLLILRDGDPGEPAVTLSPLRYHYQHRAEVEAVVQAGTGRDAAFDALAAGVGTALAADRTLGGPATGSKPRRRGRSILQSTARRR